MHVGLYEAVVQKNVHGVLLKMFPFVLCILALGISAAMAFAAAITRSIEILTLGVQRFSSGDLNDALVVESHDEIGQLAATFNEMTEKLKATTVSREYMEKLIDCMDDVLVVISPEGVIQSVNRAYCELFECRPETVIGRRMDEFDERAAPVCMYSAFHQTLAIRSGTGNRMHLQHVKRPARADTVFPGGDER